MIIINNAGNEFHLQTANTSYILRINEFGHLENLYYGRRIKPREAHDSLVQRYGTALGNSTAYSTADECYNLDSVKLEVSTYGKGDYRELSTLVELANGSRTCDFTYEAHQILEDKHQPEGLPSSFDADGAVNTLEITLRDLINGLSLKLYYSAFEKADVIARSMAVVNGSGSTMMLRKAMSMNLDFCVGDDTIDVLTLSGKWIRECQLQRSSLQNGTFSIDSKKGTSSSKYNPFLCIAEQHTNEQNGRCYGFGLVYSGNHQALAERTSLGFLRVQMGINPHDFGWKLESGEEFQTPEVLMTYSDKGLSQMSRNFHTMIKRNIICKQWQDKERPILINNWEATYFDFNEGKLLKLAREAKTLGIELFVLDDGWFGKRDNDKSSLGDWFENVHKLPGGLEGLSKKINEAGLDFGLWVEPEMVSVESELYKAHPEWAMKNPDREPSFGRNQLVLDLANPDVVEYLYKVLADIFKRSNVKYVKWDMNRNFSDQYSAYLPADRQNELTHRYVLGLYKLLERLTSQFPGILFESCSSGGNRFDLGMLCYMPQTWTSDDTDAVERYSIQYGTSMLYPQSTMGAHVSGAPSHQVLRRTPIETRFNVAAFGLLGYELDLTRLSNFDKKAIKQQIAYYKQHRKLLQFGEFFRLQSPFDTNQCVWMVVSEDKKEALLGYYQKLQQANPVLESLRLIGLDDEQLYEIQTRQQYVNIRTFGELMNDFLPVKIRDNGVIHSVISANHMFKQELEQVTAYGDELMYAGFKPKSQFIGTGYNDNIRFVGDFGSRLYFIKSVEE